MAAYGQPLAAGVGGDERLDRLAARAEQLRHEIGRKIGVRAAAAAEAAARVASEGTTALSSSSRSRPASASRRPAAAASKAAARADAEAELAMARDPMHNNAAGSGRTGSKPSSKGSGRPPSERPAAAKAKAAAPRGAAQAAKAPSKAKAPPPKKKQAIPLMKCCLQLMVQAAELVPDWAEELSSCQTIAMRYAVPFAGEGGEIEVALCEGANEDGSLIIFQHGSAHEFAIRRENLEEIASQPLPFQMLVQRPGAAEGEVLEFASGMLPWHEILMTEAPTHDIAMPLIMEDGQGNEEPIGQLHVTLAFMAECSSDDEEEDEEEAARGGHEAMEAEHDAQAAENPRLAAADTGRTSSVASSSLPSVSKAAGPPPVSSLGAMPAPVASNLATSARAASAAVAGIIGLSPPGSASSGDAAARPAARHAAGAPVGRPKSAGAPAKAAAAKASAAAAVAARNMQAEHDDAVEAAARMAAARAAGMALPRHGAHPDQDDDDDDDFDLHLHIELGAVHLTSTTVQGVRAVLKLGPTQEVTAKLHPTGVGAQASQGSVECSALSEEAVWRLDPRGGRLLGPVPERIFLQLWRGCDLLALTRMPLTDLLPPEAAQELCQTPGAAAELFDDVVELRSANSGDLFGAVHVVLHVGTGRSLAHALGGGAEQALGGHHHGSVPASPKSAGDINSHASTNWQRRPRPQPLSSTALASDALSKPAHSHREEQMAHVQHLLRAMVARIQLVHGPHCNVLRLLSPYTKPNGTVDESGFSVALENMMSSKDSEMPFSLKQIELVVAALLDDHKRTGVPATEVAGWLTDTSAPDAAMRALLRTGSPHSTRSPAGSLPHAGLTSPRHCKATLRLPVPLSEHALMGVDFVELFESGVARALDLTPGRVDILHAAFGSPTIDFEILPGPPGERQPAHALRELHSQLEDACSRLRAGPLGQFIGQATLEIAGQHLPAAAGGARTSRPTSPQQAMDEMEDCIREILRRVVMMIQEDIHEPSDILAVLDGAAQHVSREQPELWCLPGPMRYARLLRIAEEDARGAAVAVAAWEMLDLTVPPLVAIAGLHAVADLEAGLGLRVTDESLRNALAASLEEPESKDEHSGLLAQIFEVMAASGVDPVRAFNILDRDNDGIVSLRDYETMLRVLGLPTAGAELHAHPSPQEGAVTFEEFRRLYAHWMAESGGPAGLAAAQQPRVLSPKHAAMAEDDAHLMEFMKQRATARTAQGMVDGPLKAAMDDALLMDLMQDAGPEPAAHSECLDLPSFIVFAILDEKGAGEITVGEMQRFVEQCVGFVLGDGQKAAMACDLAGRGVVAYRDFRKYYSRLDKQRAERMGQDGLLRLGGMRAAFRAILEVVDQQPGTAERSNADAAIEQALRSRHRSLEVVVDSVGLAELLSDLRLPAHIAGPLIRSWAAVGPLAHAKPTYDTLLEVMRRALELLRSHLDPLLGACMAAEADLSQVLDFALRRNDQMLSVKELTEVLHTAKVNLRSVEMEDVLRVLDPHHLQRFPAPELIRCYKDFCKRHGGLLKKLARHLGSRGMSPEDLFARAAHLRALGPRLHTPTRRMAEVR
eukprot:TRINITY_DN6854_c0_g1_i1.p1 TRINITY_DN6854_c0_g1~~TRINITY_DN6854_c0_g1_i1.p1  ORF type:complete len:1568 (+),score=388.73 TRINITY_DN6854_c0_g1_i1:95-4798(+)